MKAARSPVAAVDSPNARSQICPDVFSIEDPAIGFAAISIAQQIVTAPSLKRRHPSSHEPLPFEVEVERVATFDRDLLLGERLAVPASLCCRDILGDDLQLKIVGPSLPCAGHEEPEMDIQTILGH